MDTKEKALLDSKLKVFQLCYQRAEKQKDQTRMNKIEPFIDELREEIRGMA